MEDKLVQPAQEPDDLLPLDRFLAQPAWHSTDSEPVAMPDPAHRPHRNLGQALIHFLFEKKPSGYSSIAPRRADGTRVGAFFFNGGGRGR